MRTVGVVATIRVALWVLPFPRVQQLVRRLGRRSARAAKPLTPELVAGRALTVQLASRLVPRASCLTQALALQALLGRAGTGSQLRIGVSRSARQDFEAHAWLECDGRVVIGGGAHERYVPLLTIEGSTS